MNKLSYISPWIYTTMRCNLSCEYCYINQSKATMKKDMVSSICKSFKDEIDSKRVKRVDFRISGGEPMICFDEWKRGFEDIYQNDKDRVSLSINTNLTILTDEMIDYIKKNNCMISISLDGLDYSKPYKNGKSSSEKVIENIIKIPSSTVSINSVINKNNINQLTKMAKWVAENNYVWAVNLDHFFYGELSREKIIDVMDDVVDILYTRGYDILNRFKFCNIMFNDGYDGCQAGKNLIAIGCNGEVWSCQTQIDKKPLFYIGEKSITEGIITKENIGCNYKLPKECEMCSLAKECHSGCRLHNNRKQTCFIVKAIAIKILNKSLGEPYAKL